MAKESTEQYFRSIDVDKKLIANIDNGIIIVDEALNIYYFNKWLEIYTHLKEKDVLGEKLNSVFANINVKTLQRKIRTALKMDSPSFYIASNSKYLIPIKINRIKASGFTHMRQDVSVIPFDTEKRLVALIISDQTSIVSMNILLELNIQKIEDLNKELIREKNIIDKRVLFMKINNEYLITDCSQAYMDLLGVQKIDIYLQNFFNYENLKSAEELTKEILNHIQEKKVYKYEKITLTDKEKEITLLNTLVPEYDKNGMHIGFIIFSENITSAKLVQKQQQILLQNSRTSAMGEMISMIAHQWRQPLSVINTIIATLKVKKELDVLDDATLEESYDKIEKTVSYLSDTIDDFRNFFKTNKELSLIPIQTIFDKATNLLMGDIKAYKIHYTENISDDIKINTYKNELIQTLINILKNSIDAFKDTPRENQTLTVKVWEEPRYVIIEIEDNAGGIKEEIVGKVLEPYFSTKSKNGTGLGLYLCKTIVEEHLNGELTIKSKGVNTTSIIKLAKNLENKKEEI
ncbi:MAG: PAS domain-containing protein [Helicobacteraceae bacterium]|nr:PAS domain-containing protein [Candidatus Sulfurimonas ponti]MBL6973357.1 PAS domain-containing protein [Sulfurimonas sp.]